MFRLAFSRVQRRFATTATATTATISPAIVKGLVNLLGKDAVLTEDIAKYTTDWTNFYHGGQLVVKPSNAEDVSKILSYCNENKVPVVPQGGNTGLVGGQVGFNNEVIISLERMNKIISIDPVAAVVIVEAGCILETLNAEVGKHGFLLPLDLGSKGSCQIGGNVATNAGGLRLLRYGSMQENVLGLEVIQADGNKLDMLRTIHKDNCGYHLKNLFVGSEGSLGIITKVAMQLKPLPLSVNVTLSKLASMKDVPKFLHHIRQNVSEIISAVELIDQRSVHAVHLDSPAITSRLNTSSILPILERPTEDVAGIGGEVMMLLETSGSSSEHDKERLENLLGEMIESGIVVDAVMAQDQTQLQSIWTLREHVPVSLMHLSRKPTATTTTTTTKGVVGRLYKYDVSLPVSQWSELIEIIQQHLQQQGFPVNNNNNSNNKSDKSELLRRFSSLAQIDVCCFGHVGDQNLHLNVLLTWKNNNNNNKDEAETAAVLNDAKAVEEYKLHFKSVLDRVVYEDVTSRGGSISAEHGIGQQKVQLMKQARTTTELQLMVALKQALDPNNILNPGKVIPAELLLSSKK